MLKAFRKDKPPTPEKVVHNFRAFTYTDAPQEHQFQMLGLDVVISHSLKIVWVLDTTGAKDDGILLELEEHLKKMDYFLFHTATVPDKTPPAKPA